MFSDPDALSHTDGSEVFSREALNRIFATSPKDPERLISRESSSLEFKEAFGFGTLGKYMRTAAGFANSKGGYSVYGVKDKPHCLVGLKSTCFNDLDPEKLTEWFNTYFDPEIRWERHLYEIEGKTMGLLYFPPSKNRPVICRKTADDGKALKEGEIYYRYNGRTQTIRYAELKELINENRKQEELLWLRHLKTIARIGISDAAVFDLRRGEVKGQGGNLLIDESLLSQIAFIREGEFSETKGRPTLKLVGHVEAINGGALSGGARPQIVKTQGIRTPDIVMGFLKRIKVPDPSAYLTQVCYESSAYLPIYYYISQAGLDLAGARTLVEKQHSSVQSKAKLLERLAADHTLPRKMPCAGNPNGARKLALRSKLLAGSLPGKMSETELADLLDLVPTVAREEIPLARLCELLVGIFNAHFGNQDSFLNHRIRRAICYLDWLHFRPAVDAIADI